MPDGVNIPGGPSFIGLPQPPDVPCDPTGDGWRGPPGQQGQPGIQGPPGSSIGGAYYIASYGAKSDGVTDDSAAVSATVAAAIAAGGGMVVLSAGRTMLASAITVSIPATVTITIEGMGPQASELYFSGATDGLSFTLLNSGSFWGSVHLHGFSVIRGPTSPTMAGTGINIIGDPAVAKQCSVAMSFRDLIVRGSTPLTNSWTNSMILDGVSGLAVDNLHIVGLNSSATDNGDAGLTITGPTNPHFATSINISNSGIQGCSVGVLIKNFVQGVFMSACTVIGQYDSIRWLATAAQFAEEMALTNCSLNGGHRGIYVSHVNGCAINNTDILHFGSGVTTPWAGIEINTSAYTALVGNMLTGALAANETGILLSDCGNAINTVIGNQCTNIQGYGLWLQGDSARSTVVGNNFVTSGPGSHGGILEDQSGANTIATNLWNGVDVPYSPFIVSGTLWMQGQIIYQNAAASHPNRWFVTLSGTDPDDNTDTGSDFTIVGGHDIGGITTAALSIKRSTSVVTLSRSPIIATLPVNAANDAAAASAGVQIGGIYRNGSAVQIRVS